MVLMCRTQKSPKLFCFRILKTITTLGSKRLESDWSRLPVPCCIGLLESSALSIYFRVSYYSITLGLWNWCRCIIQIVRLIQDNKLTLNWLYLYSSNREYRDRSKQYLGGWLECRNRSSMEHRRPWNNWMGANWKSTVLRPTPWDPSPQQFRWGIHYHVGPSTSLPCQFHSLLCFELQADELQKSLRQEFSKFIRNESPFVGADVYGNGIKEQDSKKLHYLIHCFDYLRQKTSCQSDLTLEGLSEDSTETMLDIDGYGVEHNCKSRVSFRNTIRKRQDSLLIRA
jgi:hypothetical protein